MIPDKTPCFEAPKALPTRNREDIWRPGSIGEPNLPVNVATPRNKEKPVVIATGLFQEGIREPEIPISGRLFRRNIKIPQSVLKTSKIDLEYLRMPIHRIIVAQ